MNQMNRPINKPVNRPMNRAVNTNHAGRLLLTTLVITLLAVSLSSCSSLGSNKSKKHKTLKNEPVKLITLAHNIKVLQSRLKVNAGSVSRSRTASLKLEPSFDGQRIFTVSDKGKVKAVSITGGKLWSVHLDADITGGITVDNATKTLVVSTQTGKIIALNSETGRYKWTQQLSGSVLTPALISKNRVLLSANNGILHGLNLQTGRSVWQYSTQVPNISVRGMAKPIYLTPTVALFSTANGRIYAIDTVSGNLQWSRRVGLSIGSSDVHRMSDIDATPIVNGNSVYAISYSGQLVQVKKTDGSVTFVKDVSSVQTPAVTTKNVIISGSNGKVTAFNKKTGHIQWENTDLLYRLLSNPVSLPNTNYIAVGDYDGIIHVINQANGKIISREKTSGAVISLQVLSGQLLSQTKSGKIEIWQF